MNIILTHCVCCCIHLMNVYFCHRCKQLQETTGFLEERNATLESQFSEVTQRLLECQAREADYQDQLTSALPLSEKTELETHIQELTKQVKQLKLHNNQLEEVAEVSRQQIVAMETKKKSHDIELSSLRHQLLDFQTQSDERTAIGKLHHQIVALEVRTLQLHSITIAVLA